MNDLPLKPVSPAYKKHHVALLFVTIFVSLFSATDAQSPATQKTIKNSKVEQAAIVTEEELKLAAMYEDKPLFLKAKENSRLHYPGGWAHAKSCTARGCTNGCTIGFGYNLGARNAKEVRRDLVPVVGKERAQVFASYAGKIGRESYRACGRKSLDRSTLPTMTRKESWQLLAKSMEPHKKAVTRRIAKEDLQDMLTEHQVAVLVALDFQNPRLASRAKMIWYHMKLGDFDQVAQEITQNSGSQILAALQPRRNAEAKIFLSALQ